MNLQEKISNMDTKILQKLAQAKDAKTLRTIAEKESVSLTQEEAEGAFAALYPVREKAEISEDDLQCISGGFIPSATYQFAKNHNHIDEKSYIYNIVDDKSCIF